MRNRHCICNIAMESASVTYRSNFHLRHRKIFTQKVQPDRDAQPLELFQRPHPRAFEVDSTYVCITIPNCKIVRSSTYLPALKLCIFSRLDVFICAGFMTRYINPVASGMTRQNGSTIRCFWSSCINHN